VAHARVLIVDDHPLVREGLAERIALQPGLEVCGEAAEVDEALSLIDLSRPELVIVDLTLRRGHGLDLIKKANQRIPPPKMLVLSAHDESLFAHRAVRAGASGYVNKQEAQQKIIDAIWAVLRGERYVSESTARQLAEGGIGAARTRSGIEGLSDRELEVFELIGRGKGTRSIAEQLHISVHTVETHRENIRAKLNLRSGPELVRAAVQWVLESTRG